MSKIEKIKTNEITKTTYDVEHLAASGLENVTMDDITLPRLILLQGKCKQLFGATKIPGAKEGMLYNTITGDLIDASETPIEIVPLKFVKYANTYSIAEDGGKDKWLGKATTAEVAAAYWEGKKMYTTNAKGEVVLFESVVDMYVLYNDFPTVIGFKGAKLKVMQSLMTLIKMRTLVAYYCTVLLKVKEDANDKNSFFNYDIKYGRETTADERQHAFAAFKYLSDEQPAVAEDETN